MKEKLKIQLEHYTTVCTDGCCRDFGCSIKVDDVELENMNEDFGTMLTNILEHLGYEVEVNEIWTDENGKLY